LAAIARHGDRDGLANLMIVEASMESGDALHGLAVNRHHDVTGDDTSIASQPNAAQTDRIRG
jgi:hypothetical protein